MKKTIIFLMVFISVVFTASPIANAKTYNSNITLNCKIDYLLSLDNDTAVVSKNENLKAAPASITKITTALVVLQNCKDLSQVVTVSQASLDVLKDTGSSLAGLKAGEKFTVLQLLNLMLIPSGNDAAVVLAEHIGGNVGNFVEMMNKCVAELGCKNTHYMNPHGLDENNHYSTAHDIAVISREALKYEEFVKIVATPEYMVEKTNLSDERKIINTNYLINKSYNTYYRGYVKGIKTGTTDNAGNCVVTYASKNGYTYLAVAMGGDRRDSDNDNIDENQAFMDSIRMYEWAFKNLSYELIASPSLLVSEVRVNYSWKTDHMRLVPEKDVRAIVPTGTNEGSVLIEPIDKPDEVNAPIKAGDYACKAKIIYANSEIAEINLVYAENVRKNYLLFFLVIIKKIITNPVFVVLLIAAIAAGAVYFSKSTRIAQAKRKKNKLKIVKINDMSKENRRKYDKNYKPKH